MSDGKKPPVLKLHAGCLKVAVWENEHEGKKFHSVTLQRSYKDDKGEWHDTNSLPTRDLAAAAALLLDVYREIEIKELGKKPGQPEETPW